MKDDQQQFLRLSGQLPARLTTEQAAWVLNCGPHDIPVLVAARLLKPLGNPARNGLKYFATVELEERRRDTKWLARASDAIVNHWQNRNARKSSANANLQLPDHQESVLAES